LSINEDAPVVSRAEIVIAAPIEPIWKLHTDVDSWAHWYPDVDSARADGPLGVGSTFRWRTAGLDITSTVIELEPPRRIEWGGPGNGITAVHVWTFTESEQGVLVKTEESWEGEPIEAAIGPMQTALDESLKQWLRALKGLAEGAATH